MPDPTDDGNVRRINPDRVPPNDMASEAAVLAYVLGKESTEAVRSILKKHHFYSDANQKIYAAAVAIELTGQKPDVLTVRGYLEDSGRLQDVGGVKYLVHLFDEVPAVSNPDQYARRIVEKAAMRSTIEVARQIAAEGYSASPGLIQRAIQQLESIEVEPNKSLVCIPPEEIFADLPSVPWVVPGLYLASGRPVLVAGYGYSAKTVSMMALLLAVASGLPVWGRYRVQRQGVVLHIDHEQGSRATKWRYQRLARWMGIDPESVMDSLRVVTLPRGFHLSNHDAEDVLTQACQDVEVCLIDSLRASTPDLDENDSVIRSCLDKLTRVSEKTGTTFIVIHHAGKGAKDRDTREAARGSSAIFDACGCVLSLSGKQDDDNSTTVQVEMTKAPADAAGGKLATFFLKVDDVTSDAGQERWGLKCEHRTKEQISPPKSAEEALEAVCADVLAIVTGEAQRAALANPGAQQGVSGNFVRGMYRGKDAKLITPALERLASEGKIVQSKRKGKGGGYTWTILEETD